MDTVLWLCPSLPTETLKWLSSLPILMQESFWWWQCSDRYIISLYPPPPSPSLISLMVFVDVKHHVYLLRRGHSHKQSEGLGGVLLVYKVGQITSQPATLKAKPVVVIVQELCESRGGRPGLSVLTSLLVSVDVKLYWTMLRHWSQLVPNMSTDIWGH